MTSRTKIIAIVLGVVVILGLVYVAFFNNSNSSSSITTTDATPNPDAQTFLDLAGRVDPISFDTSILGDPRFAALVDIHTAVIPVPVGRKDPFSGIAGMNASAATNQSSQPAQATQPASQTTQPSQ